MVLNPVWMAPYLVPPSIKPADPTWLELLQNENWSWNILDTLCLFIGVIYFLDFLSIRDFEKKTLSLLLKAVPPLPWGKRLDNLDICKLSSGFDMVWPDRPWQSWQAGQFGWLGYSRERKMFCPSVSLHVGRDGKYEFRLWFRCWLLWKNVL